MKSRYLFAAVLVIAAIAVVSSWTGKNALQRTSTVRGINITNLVDDLREFAIKGAGTDWTWKGNDARLPGQVRALSPIRVTLRKTPQPAFFEVKFSGGFWNHGLIVLCDTNAPFTNIVYGNGWQVTRLGDGIYEYKGP